MGRTISQNWQDFDSNRPMDITFVRFHSGTKVRATVVSDETGEVEMEGVLTPLTETSISIDKRLVRNNWVKRVVFLEY